MPVALISLLACEEAAAPKGVTMRSDAGIVASAVGYEARMEAAWRAAGPATLTGNGVDVIAKVGNAAVVDQPGTVKGIPADAKVRKLDEFRPVLLGTDEDAAADAIRAAGARLVIVHADIRPSFDRDSRVLSRLYHHDYLNRFQLYRVEDNALVYLVVDKRLQFPPELASAAIQWVRETLAGRNPAPFTPAKPERSDWTIVTTLRGQGHELAFSLAQADTLDLALKETVRDLEAHYRRNKEILGFPRLDRAIDGLTIEMHRVTERAPVVLREDKQLAELWEMGVDGAVMIDNPSEEERKKGARSQSGVYPGSVAAYRSYTAPDQMLKAMARDFKWDSVRPWHDEGVKLELIRTVHYIERRDHKGVVELVRGTMAVPMEHVTLASVSQAIIYMGEWYLSNLHPDGTVTYKMWPEDARYSDEYNHVRHELATWNLWQSWTLDPRPEFLAGAKKAQEWTLRSLVVRHCDDLADWEKKKVDASPYKSEICEKGMAYFNYQNVAKLGSNVVGLLGMIDVARAEHDHSMDTLIAQLGRFALFSQEGEGNVRPYHVPPGHAYENQRNDIVPGETALALTFLAEYFDDPSWIATIPKFFEFYQPWFRTRAARRTDKGPWPAYIYDNQSRLDLVQFGPWTVMAAAAYTRLKPEAKDIAMFGLEVGKWMVDAYMYRADRSPWPDYVGSYYKYEGELPAMQAFCYGEGTAAAYDLALRYDPSQVAYFEEATRATVRFGLQVQHDAMDTRPYSRYDEVLGGIKYAMNEPKVRIDYVYHAQSAMYQWLTHAREDARLPAAVRAEPTPELVEVMRLQGMPGYRDPDTPRPATTWHEALPGIEAEAAARADDEGGGE
jgi:hypothetical protein